MNDNPENKQTDGGQPQWVRCPVCGEPDMRKEYDREGDEYFPLIFCVNHACGSGGENFSAVPIPRDLLVTANKKDLRDEIAIAAIQGTAMNVLWAISPTPMSESALKTMAKHAYQIADAMIAARKGGV